MCRDVEQFTSFGYSTNNSRNTEYTHDFVCMLAAICVSVLPKIHPIDYYSRGGERKPGAIRIYMPLIFC